MDLEELQEEPDRHRSTDNKTHHGGQHIRHNSFSAFIDAVGYGPFQTRLVLLCGMGCGVDAIEVLIVSFVLEAVANTFNLGSVEKGLAASASFLGMMGGAVFWSIMADRRGRRPTFLFSLLVAFLAGIGSALAPSFLSFLLLRVIVGFGVGGNIPAFVSLTTEFMPTPLRATVLIIVIGVFWGVGQVCASAIGLLLNTVIGYREDSFWRWLMALAATPSVVPILLYRLLPESPRFLSVTGRHEAALEGLEELARVNGKLALVDMLRPARQQDENDNGELLTSGMLNSSSDTGVQMAVPKLPGSVAPYSGRSDDSVGGAQGSEGGGTVAGDVRELFHTPILRRVTLCLWAVWFFENFSYYGIVLLLPRYYAAADEGNSNFTFVLTGLVGILYIPGFIGGLWLCSEHRLGRVGALKWTSHATGLLLLLMAASYGVDGVFIPVSAMALMSISAPATIKFIITSELYATKYRTVGLGSASLWTRIGGFIAPLVSEVLFDRVGPAAPLVVFAPMLFIMGFFAGMIPVETAGIQLDDDSWDKRDNNQGGNAPGTSDEREPEREGAAGESYSSSPSLGSHTEREPEREGSAGESYSSSPSLGSHTKYTLV